MMRILVDNSTRIVIMAGDNLTSAEISAQRATWCTDYSSYNDFTVYDATLPLGFAPLCWTYSVTGVWSVIPTLQPTVNKLILSSQTSTPHASSILSLLNSNIESDKLAQYLRGEISFTSIIETVNAFVAPGFVDAGFIGTLPDVVYSISKDYLQQAEAIESILTSLSNIGDVGSAAADAARAVQAASDAVFAKNAAEGAATTATTQATSAATSSNDASLSATAASTSASNAATSAGSAGASASAADSSKTAASVSATGAANSAAGAESSASSASSSATNAAAYKTAAETASTAAASAQVAAQAARDAASGSASSAANSASTATSKATDTSNSAASAATSATDASTSAGQASTSAGNAATHAGQASTSASNASSSASNAASSATTAANAATTATNQAAAAATSASTASSQATAAAQSASSATSSANAANTSVSSALNYKNSAAQSATDAAGSATAAAYDFTTLSARLNNAGGTGVSVETVALATATNIGDITTLQGMNGVRIVSDGYVAGYGLLVTDTDGHPTSGFTIIADIFKIAPVATSPTAADNCPFYFLTTPTVVNGKTVPAGAWFKKAFMSEATVDTLILAGQSVTVTTYAKNAGNVTISNSESTIVSSTPDFGSVAPQSVVIEIYLYQNGGSTPSMTFKLYKGASLLSSKYARTSSVDGSNTTVLFVDESPSSGSSTYTLKGLTSSGTVIFTDVLMTVSGAKR
jgi:hypothetical protein